MLVFQTPAFAQPEEKLQPFFDGDERTIAAPPPPYLDAFDRAVLTVCGAWGSRPSRQDFRAMLDDAAVRPAVADIYDRLGHAILNRKQQPSAFKDALTDVWFEADGFRHIFCGEPHNDGLGGLHFVGRYIEMQKRGWGGIFDDCPREEIAPPVYTLGMLYQTPDGLLAESCPKGYALDTDAADIFVEATIALRNMRSSGKGDGMCLHQVDEGDYLAVFVVEDSAIRTFYPDASPRCDGGQNADACLCDE